MHRAAEFQSQKKLFFFFLELWQVFKTIFTSAHVLENLALHTLKIQVHNSPLFYLSLFTTENRMILYYLCQESLCYRDFLETQRDIQHVGFFKHQVLGLAEQLYIWNLLNVPVEINILGFLHCFALLLHRSIWYR